MAASVTLRVSLVVMTLFVGALILAATRWTDRRAGRDGVPRYFVRAAVVLTAWFAATAAAAGAGLLSFETRPPTMFVMLAGAFVLTVGTGFSRLGTRLATTVPLVALVGFQAFRIFVELWLHRGYQEGVFPVQMTYAGFNFDVVSGGTALIVAALVWRGRAPVALVLGWNLLGLALLATIVTIAILSAPVPFRVFDQGPANVWVTGFPGVWLPAVLVQAALLGHLLVFRRLASRTDSGTNA